jgi:TfoX/Sxy family transcriptional regulator of competence genes
MTPMAYDEDLAARVRTVLSATEVEEKKMFGGLAFMVNTHMACGVLGDDLLVRVDPDGYEQALEQGALG